MIDLLTKIHNKLTLEFKISYRARHKVKINDFTLNTWIFVPNSLGINSQTYRRDDFYKDVRTNLRLITPVFLLREIVADNAVPLKNLENAMRQMASSPTRTNEVEYEYQIKMFSAIFKSAIRDQSLYIINHKIFSEKVLLFENFIADVRDILTKYRSLANIIQTPTVTNKQYDYYNFGDEFLSNVTEKTLYRLLLKIDKLPDSAPEKNIRMPIAHLLQQEAAYRVTKGFPSVSTSNDKKHSNLIFRFGALKKYIESDLFLNANKKREGVLVEQVYYSIAAGLSMIFATGIAFSFQKTYGNFTMPLFVALVVSYMLKDRIKELMRYYFAYKMGGKYFDNKTTLSLKENQIGWSKEGFDFIPEKNIPKEVLKTRNRIPLVEADNRYAKETIILYRKSVQIDREILDQNSSYDIAGIVEILRLNMTSFMKNADNPEFPVYALEKDFSLKKIIGEKNYYLNFVFHFKYETVEKYKRFRVTFNRDKVVAIEEIK
ncbi:MAG: hypothetical protein BWY08_00695 [Bacteroidetes bacterium ADurb.Bin174]|nr:MAG: hypothetical protein BWY08_00695 [Bacteroidetes bacterium ADurb.Bin174]